MNKLRLILCVFLGHRSIRVCDTKFLDRETKNHMFRACFECERCGGKTERVYK